MNWSEICMAFPNQWLIIEALEAHTDPDNLRHFDRLSVVEKCEDGSTVMKCYRELHRKYPQREIYFVHTDRPELDIRERHWVGARPSAANAECKPPSVRGIYENGKVRLLEPIPSEKRAKVIVTILE